MKNTKEPNHVSAKIVKEENSQVLVHHPDFAKTKLLDTLCYET